MPFLPLQTLWVNFTTQVFQAVGFGYGKPAEGLMDRKPRSPDERILPRPCSLVHRRPRHGRRHARLIAWARRPLRLECDRPHDGPDGLRVEQRLLLVRARGTSSARCSALDVLEDRTFLICTGGSLVVILFGTELGIFDRILGTVHLDLHQWLVCLVVGFAIIPVS